MSANSLIHTGPEPVASRRRPLLLGLIGLFSYGLCLLANLPAPLLWGQLASPALAVQLANVRGTVWDGSAGAATVQANGQWLALPALHWTVQPGLQLLQGKLSLAITLGGPADELEARGTVTLARDLLAVSQVTADISPQWLLSAMGNPLPGEVSGSLALQLHQLELSPQGCTFASGQAELGDIGLDTPFGSFTVGQINASLDCRDRALVATVTQHSPTLSSDGELTLDPLGGYRFRGNVRTNSTTPLPLTQALSMMAREQEGVWPLNLQGRMY